MKYKPKHTDSNKRNCGICNAEYFDFPSSRIITCGDPACKTEARAASNRRHGESYSRLYAIWHGMNTRCRHNPRYKHLSVCDEWQSYEVFRDWAHVNGYTDTLEIDRKDNAKGYCPENCRWATRTQQMQNTGLRKLKNKTSVFKGVQKMPMLKRRQWRAVCTWNGKPKHLGLYQTEEDAARAYDAWAKSEYGDFACLNFKEE